jgi:hypothetical protein
VRTTLKSLALKELANTIDTLNQEPWAWSLVERQLSDAAAMQRVRPTALAFLVEATDLARQRANFVARPVVLPPGLPAIPQRAQIFQSLAEGKNPFGLLAFKFKPQSVKFVFRVCRQTARKTGGT